MIGKAQNKKILMFGKAKVLNSNAWKTTNLKF